jgi:hypothetical protein
LYVGLQLIASVNPELAADKNSLAALALREMQQYGVITFVQIKDAFQFMQIGE